MSRIYWRVIEHYIPKPKSKSYKRCLGRTEEGRIVLAQFIEDKLVPLYKDTIPMDSELIYWSPVTEIEASYVTHKTLAHTSPHFNEKT